MSIETEDRERVRELWRGDKKVGERGRRGRGVWEKYKYRLHISS